MSGKRDRGIMEFIISLIPVGYTDAQIARRVNKEKELSINSAYEYIALAYKELGGHITPDARVRAITQAAVQISLDRARALKNNDSREAGKATDRFMRLHGIDSSRVEVTMNIIDNPQVRRARIQELLEKRSRNEPDRMFDITDIEPVGEAEASEVSEEVGDGTDD